MGARGGVDRGDGDVDAVRFALVLRFQLAEVVAFAAAYIEKGVGRREMGEVERGGVALEEPPSRRDHLGRVARTLRAAILRLQQVDVSAPRDVERVPALADDTRRLLRKRRAAIAHGAEERHHSAESTIAACGPGA